MALIIKLAEHQLIDGLVTRYVGDRWELDLQVFDKVGRVQTPKDLTGCSASAVFPTNDGEDFKVEAEILTGVAGLVHVTLPAADTADLDTDSDGIHPWLEIENLGGDPDAFQSITTLEPELHIAAPLNFSGE